MKKLLRLFLFVLACFAGLVGALGLTVTGGLGFFSVLLLLQAFVLLRCIRFL